MGHYDQAYEDRYAEQREVEEKFIRAREAEEKLIRAREAEEKLIRARLPGRLKKIAEALRTLGMQGANDIDNAIRYLKVD